LKGRETRKTAIGAGQRSPETSVEKAAGFDHAGSAAISIAISQPELRRFGVASRAGSIGRERGGIQPWTKTRMVVSSPPPNAPSPNPEIPVLLPLSTF
jgi:hypothetical protein